MVPDCGLGYNQNIGSKGKADSMRVADLIHALQGQDPDRQVIVNVYDPARQVGDPRKDLFYTDFSVEATRTTRRVFVEIGVKVGDEDGL